jgi:hypothetical protein
MTTWKNTFKFFLFFVFSTTVAFFAKMRVEIDITGDWSAALSFSMRCCFYNNQNKLLMMLLLISSVACISADEIGT